MIDHDILSDDERDALHEVMLTPARDAPQRVLIVDDDSDARELLAEILSLNDISCMTAPGGDTALQMIHTRQSIGLLITDLRMAPFDGLDLIRKVRESDRAELPIIIVSGDANVRDAIDAMHLNVVDFLLKPLNTKQLVKLVKRELGIS
ncbi:MULTISPECIES: response regulator [Pseudomonas]|jgi:DNA-binding NtrC family response regulator|uniref:Response regulator receiver domain-containing protein n=5 Tax=Pseudomonas TaxID=286 RepID=A0AB37ZM85_PSESX|nr:MULTISPECIES: response regulator [Pseudomonas]AKF53526.1 Response regulator containing CheY-like receiver, AAA-type ATPase, and DNA-binding domains [Pseudomonas syringae pv. syringae HS191]ALD98054.1 response regulator [Pseudomonas syringae UMAF0158]ELQ12206.1 response regulator receiver [Pseudomonas syringae BRIP39023]KPB26937.1 Response regulator receiver [Pseudomonas syringae pv. syringae]KPY31295.1 Response regulator receiver [Pseudomonas syringae pv. papulans]